MTNPLPRVAVVILNWNGRHYLQQFLPAVLASGFPGLNIVVADNGSTDDSVAFLSATHPQVRVIRLPENLGFARGYNEALRQVPADYYVILNSDVEVTSGWLQPIIDLLEKNPSIAACQPKIRSFVHRHLFEYAGGAGGWLDRYGYPFARGRIFDVCEEDRGQYDGTEPVFWASGAAMIIRASVFHELGGFDDYFFAHQEEIDLCWRLQLAGYQVYCCPRSVVYHVGGGTLPRGNTLKTYLNFRNNQIMLFKNLPWKHKWWKIPYRILLDAISAWKGLLSGEGGYFLAILRAHFAFGKWLLLYQRKSRFPIRRSGRLQGLYRGNLVWQHFIRRKRFFSEIIQ